MSAKSIAVRERTQRFRRRMSGQKAVSPVVATLILILIAVAAAAALYLWLVAWQGNITGGIGNQQVQATFTIGGSTSVYPFSALAVSWYEQNHSDVNIQDDEGGTGAGMLAVCAGHIDVGAASTPETVSGLQSSDGCPLSGDITITTIAYDAVDVVINNQNPHGLLSISWDTLTAIYDGASITPPDLLNPTIDGVSVLSGGPLYVAPFSVHGALEWGEIPASVAGATFDVYEGAAEYSLTEQASAHAPTVEAAGVACGLTSTVSAQVDVCDGSVSGGAPTGTPCGFVICAGGTTAYPAAASIVPIERSDASGTTQTFEAKLLGATSSSGFAKTFSSLGYNGCGTDNLLSDCGIFLTTAEQANSDPAALAAVAASPNNIGYASDGLARTASGIGSGGIVPFLAVGQAVGTGLASPATSAGLSYGGVTPTTGATGTIAAGITDSSSANQYSGWRPFEFVTLNPPAGEVSDFFTFLLAPDVNQNLATAAGEVSIYSV